MDNQDIISYLVSFFDIYLIVKCSILNKTFYRMCGRMYKPLMRQNFNLIPKEDGISYRKKYLRLHDLSNLASNIDHPGTLKELFFKTSLRMRKNEIPREIRLLTNLTELYMVNNKIPCIPPCIKKLVSLTILDLCMNCIEELPVELFRLTNLCELTLYENRIRHIPVEITLLTNLTNISFSQNQLTHIPDYLSSLTQLRYLDVAYNQLDKIPQCVRPMLSLCHIYLTGNKITSINGEFQHLSELYMLELSENHIETINNFQCHSTELAIIELHDNRIQCVTVDVDHFTYLDLSHNLINPMSFHITQPLHITVLLLRECNLTIIPEIIYQMYNLKGLYFDGNQIHTISSEISNLTDLEILNMDNNYISSMEHLMFCARLSSLFLSNNQITIIPPEIENCTRLRYLILNKNRISSLPHTFWKLTNLEYLQLANNQLFF